MRKGYAAICYIFYCGRLPVWAGFCSADSSPSETRHDFEFLAGYSPVSATLIGTTADRRFILAGFSYSYRAGSGPAYRYLIPASSCLPRFYCSRDNICHNLFPLMPCMDSR